MKRLQAIFMLCVLAMVLTPWHIMHNVLANHTTEQDSHCREFHKGVHIEESHAHCAWFDVTSLAYNSAEVPAIVQHQQLIYTVYSCSAIQVVFQNNDIALPSRAPPVA